MTSSGSGTGGGDRSPAPPRAVVDGLLDVRARAEILQTMFDGSSPTPPRAAGKELVEGMMSSVTSALSALSTSGGASSHTAGSGGGRRKKGAAAVAGPIRRSSGRRRTVSPFLETVTTDKQEDGHAWRKYGQKQIQDCGNPRSYYRCTHMPDQGCMARKHVQVSDTNPSEYIINYFGKHTCRDLSTIPLVIEAATDDVPPTNCANFICFGSATTTSSAAAVPHHRLSRFAGYSTSLPAVVEQKRCGSEEAISSGLLGDVVGSAPEYRWPPDGEASGIDTGSFPSSPTSSLGGFLTGSFGNGGMDDDLFGFGFDP